MQPFPKKEKVYNIDYPPELRKVNKLIVNKKTGDAKIEIQNYLNRAENIHWYGHAYFLMGFLYEVEEKPELAIKHYREAIQHAAAYDNVVEARALYNLSFVYERTGNWQKLVSTLIDLLERRQYLDVLSGQVETPARLAAAYAVIGRMDEAKKFHKQARENYENMVRQMRFHSSRSDLSKALYYLGLSVFPREKENFSDLKTKLSLGQKYLLASVESAKGGWADRAAQSLEDNYQRLWAFIQDYQKKGLSHDPMAKMKQKQMDQLVMASDFYDLVLALRSDEFPMGNVNLAAKEVMDGSQKWLARIENFANSLQLGPETIRTHPVKQRRLMRYVDEPKKPVRVNKESTALQETSVKMEKTKSESKKDSSTDKGAETPLPEKDPNL